MIEPIKLTEFGEMLESYPDSKVGDERELSTCIGVHGTCSGWVDIKQVSKTHQAILCRSCNLRVVIPKEIKTYGQLRQYLKKLIL